MVRRFSISDTAQHMVGGFLLAGPFVVTEEVWRLAENMSLFHSFFTVLIVLVIGYGALYKADADRDPDKESEVAGIPLRLVSLVLVSYFSVAVLIFVLTAPQTFEATYLTAFKVMGIAAIFSEIGAATADTIF
ncbi:hypothetical protein AKJ38_02940 [candidate division MSBL1 archaeon SCGC-AAA259I14]|uniref:DUF2391 domain-containing protein n=1 Tax=candidate division MSBL1 archaeon SCGC-AAA259I14 TaxID=1698268 RepID=A0A133UQX6_9EURY|nr:hypothetical protein AKJ38_02940 [candidate division MSBL1 archaeon SCGC-AAA259I14]